MFTKEYITGIKLNLKSYNLGEIKQPIVDDFMYDYDFIDFVKPYYTGMSLSYDENIKSKKAIFLYFLISLETNNEMAYNFYKGLELLYEVAKEDFAIVEDEIEGVSLIINKKSLDNNLIPIAFISESNFVLLCEVVLEMCKFEKPPVPRKVVGDPKLIERYNKMEREYNSKNPNKDEVLFENIVREVMIIKNVLYYKDIKCITVWQLRDIYITEDLRDVEDKQFTLVSNGRTKSKQKLKSWKKETKLKK